MRSAALLALLLFVSCHEDKRTVVPFALTKDHVILTGSAENNTISGETFIINKTTDTLQLQWNRMKYIAPPGWNLYFCDNVACHYVFPDSVELDPVLPGKDARMKIYAEPYGIKGEAQVELMVENKNGEYRDTITYTIMAR